MIYKPLITALLILGFPGALSAQSLPSIAVDATRPETGILQLEIKVPNPKISVRLLFADLANASDQLREIEGIADGELVKTEHEVLRTGLNVLFHLPENTKELTVHYSIDPEFHPGTLREGISTRRGFFATDGAILRTRTIFPKSGLFKDGASVRFNLPQNWKIVVPWHKKGDLFFAPANTFNQTDYLSAGQLEIHSMRIAGREVIFSRMGSTHAVEPEMLSSLLAFYSDRLGPLEPTRGVRVAAVLPNTLLHGGSSGANTIVQLDNPLTLSHEILHWWTRANLVTRDARWFHEGFTEYLSIVASRNVGAMTPQAAVGALADLQFDMRFVEENSPRSLRDASIAYAGELEARRLVYAKGALAAHALVDRVGLSKVWAFSEKVCSTKGRPKNTDELLKILEEETDIETAAWFSELVSSNRPLPSIDLGPATGASGKSRFIQRNETQ
jgi:hypothetical protein